LKETRSMNYPRNGGRGLSDNRFIKDARRRECAKDPRQRENHNTPAQRRGSAKNASPAARRG
jgi:hypothetical protein